MSKQQKPVYFGTTKKGYEIWVENRPDRTVAVHQLLAISEGEDPGKVFSNGEYHVHHKNGIQWDNRPDNIELLSVRQHSSIHGREINREDMIPPEKVSKERLKELRWDMGMSHREISDVLGISAPTVARYIKDYGIAWDQGGPNG